jgi:hypothetical protein
MRRAGAPPTIPPLLPSIYNPALPISSHFSLDFFISLHLRPPLIFNPFPTTLKALCFTNFYKNRGTPNNEGPTPKRPRVCGKTRRNCRPPMYGRYSLPHPPDTVHGTRSQQILVFFDFSISKVKFSCSFSLPQHSNRFNRFSIFVLAETFLGLPLHCPCPPRHARQTEGDPDRHTRLPLAAALNAAGGGAAYHSSLATLYLQSRPSHFFPFLPRFFHFPSFTPSTNI